MSKVCQITGKKAQIGNNVSHSKHRTKRSFDVNLFSKKGQPRTGSTRVHRDEEQWAPWHQPLHYDQES